MDDRYESIQKYIDSFNPYSKDTFFQRTLANGNKNVIYIFDLINERRDDFNAYLRRNETLKSEKRLYTFNNQIKGFETKVFKLIYELEKFRKIAPDKKARASNIVLIRESELIATIDKLGFIDFYLKSLQQESKYITSLKAQEYVLMRLDDLILYYKAYYHIDIDQSPIAETLNALIKKVKQSIDIKKTKILIDSYNRNNINVNESLIDFSVTKGTEKIIMLYKLGVLDYLRTKEPFNTSISSMAEALSGCTGMKSETIQSYINPIYSPDTLQKNNPLSKDKSVDKVIEKLTSIGFKQSK